MTGKNDIKQFSNPCYGCTERTAECHADCEKYSEYSRNCEELRQKKAMIAQIFSPRAGVVMANRRHWMDKKRGKR